MVVWCSAGDGGLLSLDVRQPSAVVSARTVVSMVAAAMGVTAKGRFPRLPSSLCIMGHLPIALFEAPKDIFHPFAVSGELAAVLDDVIVDVYALVWVVCYRENFNLHYLV